LPLPTVPDGLPLAANIEHYVNIVREKATLRRVIQISSEVMSRGYQSEDSPQQILDDVERAIFQIANQQFRTGFQTIDVLVSEVYKQVEEISNRKSPVTGIETGFAELDKMSAGLHAADLIIVAARPGLGKTSLCLNIAQHAAIKRGQIIGIFSLEMSREQLVKRLL